MYFEPRSASLFLRFFSTRLSGTKLYSCHTQLTRVYYVSETYGSLGVHPLPGISPPLLYPRYPFISTRSIADKSRSYTYLLLQDEKYDGSFSEGISHSRPYREKSVELSDFISEACGIAVFI